MLAARWIGLSGAQGQHFALDPASVSVLGFEVDHPQRRVISQWNARTPGVEGRLVDRPRREALDGGLWRRPGPRDWRSWVRGGGVRAMPDPRRRPARPPGSPHAPNMAQIAARRAPTVVNVSAAAAAALPGTREPRPCRTADPRVPATASRFSRSSAARVPHATAAGGTDVWKDVRQRAPLWSFWPVFVCRP